MGTNLLVGYTGARQDLVAGGYPLGNGYRIYSPELMRFFQPDSMSPFGRGGLNAYVYCSGDPINHDDPSGHFGELGILGVLSSMVDAVVAEEEAANIAATVRGLVDEVAADRGLAATSAARAGSATSGAQREARKRLEILLERSRGFVWKAQMHRAPANPLRLR